MYTREDLFRNDGDHKKVNLDTADALRVVKSRRLTGVSFFVHTRLFLCTEKVDDETLRGYHFDPCLQVTRSQIVDIIQQADGFNARKTVAFEKTGTVELTRLNDCIFIS